MMNNSSRNLTSEVWNDARVVAGMERQLRLLDSFLTQGRRLGGWKLGLGAPAARKSFELSGAAIGFILQSNIRQTGETIALSGWKQPMLEGEIAVRFSDVVTSNMQDIEILERIAGIGSAIELIDLDASVRDIEGIVAANIFQRYVILGQETSIWSEDDIAHFATDVIVDNETVQSTNDPTLLTGGILQNVRHAIGYLQAFGQRFNSGDILITGAVTPNVQVAPNQRARVSIGDLGSVDIKLV